MAVTKEEMTLNELSNAIGSMISKRLLKEYRMSGYPLLSDIGAFQFSCYNDPDNYQEWLQENNIEDSDQARRKYFMEDNVTVDMEFTDHETDHSFDSEEMWYSDIVKWYGQKLADYVLETCYNKEESEGRLEKAMLADESIDLEDDEAVNKFCRTYLPTGEYYKDARGFVLSDGTMVYTEAEHNEILLVPGLKDKFDFIKMGNIRVLPNSVDIGQIPTMAQARVLRQIIGSYEGDEFYIDVCDRGAKYYDPDPDYVLGEIRRYFVEGIPPRGGSDY